ncbi:rasGEF domain-containing protein [Reticulomyxa filosa]|uniref:RasGEF domain-containing protein n=1 Tax=Reticulomyxa filosa TaxID=46433 RepID=X6NCR2_RETFI|nr:rasGEF domain-containing protein [Reticulomyxa filosa]|eukprot:ETO23766.1 rasGEF domain-containing protein [Reticulomyxa filosa]
MNHFWPIDFEPFLYEAIVGEQVPKQENANASTSASVDANVNANVNGTAANMEHAKESTISCAQLWEEIVIELRQSAVHYNAFDPSYVQWVEGEIQKLEQLKMEKKKWCEYIQQEQQRMKTQREIQKKLLRGHEEATMDITQQQSQPSLNDFTASRNDRATTSPHLPQPVSDDATLEGTGIIFPIDANGNTIPIPLEKPRSSSLPVASNAAQVDAMNPNGGRKAKKSASNFYKFIFFFFFFFFLKKLIDKTTAKEYASQLTLMDFELFLKIDPRQYLCKIMDKGNKNMKKYESLKLLIDRFQKLHQYVVITIIGANSLQTRVQLIEFFIYIAEYLLKLNNFYSFMSICSGIDSIQVRKLTTSWGFVNTSCQRKFDQFLQPICSTNKNYHALRKYIANCSPPAIPFLGIVLTDLTFINDGTADRDDKVDNHINFSKYLKFYHAFKDVIRLTRYHLHSNRNDPKLVEEINAKVYNEDATVNPVLNVQSEEEKHDPLKNFFSNQTNEENKEKEANPAKESFFKK